MVKKAKTAAPAATHELRPERRDCADCGRLMWADYAARRTVATLGGVVRLVLTVRRCRHEACPAFRKPYRPEAEGRLALPHHEFGLDVIALVGRLRYAGHRSVPEIRAALVARSVAVCERTVTNLLDRYDELLATTLTDDSRLKGLLAGQGKAVLAIDGMQPDVGHEVLWVVRDCLSGEVLLARSLLSSRQQDLAALLAQVRDAIGVPVAAVVSDGQHSIRKAVAQALPGVPHQLCHFHYLREAALPVFEADRNAKKELKKRVRKVRPIERAVEGREGPEAEAVRGYASAVRSALTDDGRPPLDAAGLRLHGRLSAISASIGRAGRARKGGCRRSWRA
jgi:transposase-like protein